MHSFANLATLQTALATFFLKESTQTLFRLRESPVLPREREVLLSQHTHTPLSLSLSPSICSVSVQHEHTHLSISLALSVCLLSFCSARAHTSLYLSPRLLNFCSACACTHTSLSLTLCSARAHTHLSLSPHLLSFCSARQRRAELNSVKHGYHVDCFSNFTCKYNQNHSTAIVIILWVFYLFRQRLDYKDFCAD